MGDDASRSRELKILTARLDDPFHNIWKPTCRSNLYPEATYMKSLLCLRVPARASRRMNSDSNCSISDSIKLNEFYVEKSDVQNYLKGQANTGL